VTDARGAAPRRGRRFARSPRSQPRERRGAPRARTRSGRGSRFPRSWRGQRPTRRRFPRRSSPPWPDVRGPRQAAAEIRPDSHRRYPIACTEPLFRRIGAQHTSRVRRPACRHPLAPRCGDGKRPFRRKPRRCFDVKGISSPSHTGVGQPRYANERQSAAGPRLHRARTVGPACAAQTIATRQLVGDIQGRIRSFVTVVR
jgi:hypothetical protein